MPSPLSCSPRRWLLLAALACALPLAARADDRLAHIFQDNMVLQREQPAPVWGWTAPGGEAEVSFGGQTKRVRADASGYWKAVLDPLPASREGRDLTARLGATTVTRKNVLVGEVWLATGQSNMVVGGPETDTGVYPFYVSPGTKAGKPEIRLQKFGAGASLEPLPDGDAGERGNAPWEVLAEPSTNREPNIPPYFAKVVRDALNVPVGVIIVAVPGTNQAAWMSQDTLKQFPGEGGKPDFYASFLAQQETRAAASKGPYHSFPEFQQAMEAWDKTKTGPSPARNAEFENFPTALYNTRVYPLAPLAIRGIIWHQGEGGPGGPYGERLVAMFAQWRKLFGQDFYTVWGTLGRNTSEPPPLAPLRTNFYRSITNVELRKAATLLAKDPRAALVEFYDLGNNVTHFLEKAEAGRRMGLAALSVAYNQPHVYTGPRLVESKIEGGKATVRFDQVGGGLVFQPSVDGISGVYLRGKTGEPCWAQVRIVGKDTAEFSGPGVADILTVSYADNSNPHETLFNSEGLPASPFTLNPAPGRDPAPAAALVAIQSGTSGAGLHVAHVRREGYVFQVRASRKGAPTDKATVTAYLPAAWQGFEVLVGGTKIDAKENTASGGRFATFEVPVDGPWVIVAEAGKADAFRKVNRY